MAYDSTTGKITAPVSIYDMQQCFANSSPDVGTIFTNAGIKMWAKFKPVRRSGLIDTTPQLDSNNVWKPDSAFTPSSPPWWKADDGNYGIDPANAAVLIDMSTNYGVRNALNSLVAKINGVENGWVYLRPRGSANNEPYRFLDVNLYNNKTSNCVNGASVSEEVMGSTESPFSIYVDLRRTDKDVPISNRDYLVPEDVLLLNGAQPRALYLGFAIYKIGSGGALDAIAWVTGSRKWNGYGILYSGSQDGIINAYTNEVNTRLKESTYKALPIFSTYELAQSGVNMSANPPAGYHVVTVPYTNFMDFECFNEATVQTIAFPIITDNKVKNNGTLSTIVKLDSTGSYYRGGLAEGVYVAIVNELWHDEIPPTAGSYAYYNYIGDVNVPDDVELTIDTLTNVPIGILDHSGWRVVVNVSGQKVEIPLQTPVNPFSPST